MVIVQLIILLMDKVLLFAEVRLNHRQPTKTVEECLVQTKTNFDIILPTEIYKYLFEATLQLCWYL